MRDKPVYLISTDGYVLFAVYNGKCHVVAVNFYNSDNYEWNLDEEGIAAQLEKQIPNINDVLMLGLFNLYPKDDHSAEIEVEIFNVVQDNYKDFWWNELIKDLYSVGEEGLKLELEEWEAFYGQKFRVE